MLKVRLEYRSHALRGNACFDPRRVGLCGLLGRGVGTPRGPFLRVPTETVGTI